MPAPIKFMDNLHIEQRKRRLANYDPMRTSFNYYKRKTNTKPEELEHMETLEEKYIYVKMKSMGLL